MTRSSLKEEFARLGPIRAVDRVSSGSPADVMLRRSDSGQPLKSVMAILALARRGISLLRAKRAIECMLDTGEVNVHLPMVEDLQTLTDELAASGVETSQTTDNKMRSAAE